MSDYLDLKYGCDAPCKNLTEERIVQKVVCYADFLGTTMHHEHVLIRFDG
jgi:hypothetical protein